MRVWATRALCAATVCMHTMAAAADPVLANREKISIALADVEAQHFMLPDSRRAALLSSEIDLFRSIEDGLNARTYALKTHLTKNYTEQEGRYITNQVERAYLAAALNVYERRVRAAFAPESELVQKRAKELWVADTEKYFNDESADISQIYFDTQKRLWPETQRRIDEASVKLKVGEPFESVVRQYSDDPGASTSNGKIQGIKVSIADGYLRTVLFNKLKIGEVSEPTPARRGIYIVRLDKKSERTKKPFDTVKNEIIATLLEADARSARVALLLELEQTPTAINEAEVRKRIPRAEIDVNELMRKIHRERGVNVSEPVKTQ